MVLPRQVLTQSLARCPKAKVITPKGNDKCPPSQSIQSVSAQARKVKLNEDTALDSRKFMASEEQRHQSMHRDPVRLRHRRGFLVILPRTSIKRSSRTPNARTPAVDTYDCCITRHQADRAGRRHDTSRRERPQFRDALVQDEAIDPLRQPLKLMRRPGDRATVCRRVLPSRRYARR